MNLELLIVTLSQKDDSFLTNIGLECSALVGNQGMPNNNITTTYFNGNKVTVYSWNERGVGLNRNNLIMRTTADIILFTDDDVVYDSGYVKIVKQAFEEIPDADGIFFNVVPIPSSIDPALITKKHRVRWYNCLRYGAPRLALKVKSLREANVYFSLLFGGGTTYSCGEDSLFIADCIKRGLKLYAYPQKIGTVTFESSTWFKGYSEKYFRDKGVFYYFLSKKYYPLLIIWDCLKKRHEYSTAYSIYKSLRLMFDGIREYKMS